MPRNSVSVGDMAEAIAIAMAEATSLPVQRGQVIVEPTKNVGEFKVTIYESAEFASRVIPFMDKFGSIPTSIGELCPVGFQTNRTPGLLDLKQHGQIIGESSSGKTSLIHRMLAHATRCPDCIIWIGGVWKLYNFVGPWLEIYRNTGIKPPFDYTVHGHEDVANMIGAFLRSAYYRQSLPMDARDTLPTIILVLDEVTFIVEDKYTKVIIHGNDGITLSQGIARVARGTHEMDQVMWLATQRDTQDNLGPEGGTTAAQMGFAFVFRIRDQHTLGRVFHKYQLEQIVNRGECWADLGPDNPIVRLRVAYPQTDNLRGRPPLHDGPKLSQISWARRDIPHVLDAGSAQAAGECYADRFQLVDDDFLEYLRKPKPTTAPAALGMASGVVGSSLSSGGIDPAELAAAEQLYAQRVNHYLSQNGNGAVTPAEASTAVMVDTDQPKKRADRVQNILEANARHGGQPMTRGEIIERLEKDYEDVVSNPRVVSNILGELLKADPPTIERTEDDRYYWL